MQTTPEITSYRSSRRDGFRRLVVRRPLTTFLVLGLSGAYLLSFIWGLAYHGVIPGGGVADTLHIAPDEVTGVLVMLPVFSAALFVMWATGGQLAMRRLLRRTFHWRVGIGWWLTILLALPTLTVGLALLMGDNLRSVDVTSLLFSQLALLLINFVVTNLWEETGWTGLLQTRLEERHNWFVAAMLTAIPFAAIHLPLQFFLGEPVTPISLAIAFGAYLLLCMLFRPLLAVVRRGTGDSLFLVALQHSVFNRTANENGIAATLLTGDARGISLLISVVLITVVTAVLMRSRLSRSYGAELARQSTT
jgi:membrane protease YdiL (CAAX protease family)